MNSINSTSMVTNLKQDNSHINDMSSAEKSDKVVSLIEPDSKSLSMPAAKVEEPSDAEVEQALSIVNKAAVFEQRSLTFTMDEESGRTVVKVIDKNTDQMIRQIPSEELLRVSQDIKKLQEEMGQSLGLLVNSKV
ncbi:flagellar protein FlaG [Rheinheimera sp. MMS21-TC3]|uniref:flagellar protein FlaG n=1 Tax=Rheinheimera sp. MMS21-TC3 TaxID=3072790 RepID=UPI0028C4D051|nr:flagellar protein FlaG [Rheinheimera sp. MMS21-TC3]WNO61825.1 flagellar protein FlaG [Rheinheimera sp. MMS21-TC3]